MRTRATRDNASVVIEHFDKLSANRDWSQLYDVADGRTYHFHVRRRRVLELLPQQLRRVIDVGCGPGVMVEAVLARGGSFEGRDLSPEMVNEAMEKYGHLENVSVKTGDIENLDLPDAYADQVICMAVIEYLKTPERALAEMARVLRPGGIAIITVPKRLHIDRLTISLSSPVRWVARMFGRASADSLPRLCLQPDELDEAARRQGLIPDGGAQYHFTPLPYPLPRVAPQFFMRLNASFERFYATRRAVPSFLAHGYVGRYRKPGSSDNESR